jgi:hypothetical protein
MDKEVLNSLFYWSINSLTPQQADIFPFQIVLTLKGHGHNFPNFTVLFQPHNVEIYIFITSLTALGLLIIKCKAVQ